MKKYMHTICGKPAQFVRGMIYYRWTITELASSVKQIRKEQKLSNEYREKKGFASQDQNYDYILIKTKD